MGKNKLKLMVVDDEPDNLDLLYRIFRREFQVFRVDSATEALQLLETEGEMAIIISDQSMPEMTGLEFLSKTVALFPDTIRILLSGYPPETLKASGENLEEAQLFECITKPWDPTVLEATIRDAKAVYQQRQGAENSSTTNP